MQPGSDATDRNGPPAAPPIAPAFDPEFFPGARPDPVGHRRLERPNPATIRAWSFVGSLCERLGIDPADRPRAGLADDRDAERCFKVLEATLAAPPAPPAPPVAPPAVAPLAGRRRLAPNRPGVTIKFDIEGNEGYLIVGFYPDQRPGEIFIRLAKEGSTLGGAVDGWAMLFSLALQNGTPLADLVDKFAYTRFEPSGRTNQPLVPTCTSVYDLVARLLGNLFVPGYRARPAPGPAPPAPIVDWRPPDEPAPAAKAGPAVPEPARESYLYSQGPPSVFASPLTVDPSARAVATGPPCTVCGCLTVPCGACHRCPNCGSAEGCG